MGMLLSAFSEHFWAGHYALHASHLLSHSVLMAVLRGKVFFVLSIF